MIFKNRVGTANFRFEFPFDILKYHYHKNIYYSWGEIQIAKEKKRKSSVSLFYAHLRAEGKVGQKKGIKVIKKSSKCLLLQPDNKLSILFIYLFSITLKVNGTMKY